MTARTTILLHRFVIQAAARLAGIIGALVAGVLMSIATTLLVPPALAGIYRRPEAGTSAVSTCNGSDERELDGDAPAAH